jgi:hypothetical protein
MIPKNGWKDMGSAPTDGASIMARYHPRDVIRERFDTDTWRVHPVQWLCDEHGRNWQWCAPGRPGAGSFALGWMTFAEFQAAQAAESLKTTEFDL